MSWIEGGAPEDLAVDQARVYVPENIWTVQTLSYKYNECDVCKFKYAQRSPNNDGDISYIVPAGEVLDLRLETTSSDLICDGLSAELGEFGAYNITLYGNELNYTCQLETSQDPVDIYPPLIIICVILIGLALLSTIATYFAKKYLAKWRRGGKDLDLENSNIAPKPTRRRVESIDTFRGIAILMMIFVNDGAGQYSLLEHTVWDGLHMADLCFPWFMWIMGVCIPISLRGNFKRGVPKLKIFGSIVKRSVILFGLGLMLNTVGTFMPKLDYLRIPGVLQRFSLVYLIVATTAMFGLRKHKGEGLSMFADVTTIGWMWTAVIILVVIHTCVVFLGPVPDCPTGYLGPGFGGNCTGGITGYVDKVILGVEHIYSNPTCVEKYDCASFDPEGILGILTSCLSVMLGVQAGNTLLNYYSYKERVVRWFSWGVVNTGLALILALPGFIPINKNLWSLSFVFTTSAAAFFFLAIIYLVQDHYRWWNGVPFKAPGMNPTILYVGHEVASNLFPFHFRTGVNNTHFFFTWEALWGVSVWTVIAYVMYFNKFFLSI